MQVSSAPIAQADILPTILQSEGIESSQDFGRSIFDVSENETRVRKSVFHSWQKGDYEEVVYQIVGSGRDLSNWEIVARGKYVGDIYD